MKIGIVKGFASKNYYGGISVQGRMWQNGLKKLGDEVYLLDNWSNYDWKTFDWIIILGLGPLYRNYIKLYSDMPSIKIASAPIIDFTKSVRSYGLRGRFQGSNIIRWYSPIFDQKQLHNRISLYLVRSDYEKAFLTKGLNFSDDNIRTVPINYRSDLKHDLETEYLKKEKFVFHCSRLLAPGKNVSRLVDAAVKYGFNLTLAGTVNGEAEKSKLEKMISGCPNIRYVGRLSDDELVDYYRRAKVFALPSLVEGVGMVALEAATYGCNIVLTKLGAPKEYYNGKAFLVDPFSVDDIGRKILDALEDDSTQPNLQKYVMEKYSEMACMTLLHGALQDFCRK